MALKWFSKKALDDASATAVVATISIDAVTYDVVSVLRSGTTVLGVVVQDQ
jgi:hypothetical protein